MIARIKPDISELRRRALELESQGDVASAFATYDHLVELEPNRQEFEEGKARTALELRDPAAVEYCARSLAFHDAQPDRQLAMILVAVSSLGIKALPLVEDFLADHPTNAIAHSTYAELMAEQGNVATFADRLVEALERFPDNRELQFAFWNTLSVAGQEAAALESMDNKRAAFGNDRDFNLLEINIANHIGDTRRASEVVHRLDNHQDAQLARAYHEMQIGAHANAAQILEGLVGKYSGDMSAWSLLEVAWRLLRDNRHDWLIGNPPLFTCHELELSAPELDEIAASLRSMHTSHAQPLGQSVRGGTQTPGQLFTNGDPQVVKLTHALAEVIRKYYQALPSRDLRHPVLRHRDMGIAFGPSWSVRLAGGGHHSVHIHPNGILSSACYISLPGPDIADQDRAGWLEIGRPPPILGVDLEPLEALEPKPGRLVLFPSFLFHGTRPFASGERLTVAFDLVPVPNN